MHYDFIAHAENAVGKMYPEYSMDDIRMVVRRIYWATWREFYEEPEEKELVARTAGYLESGPLTPLARAAIPRNTQEDKNVVISRLLEL